MFTIQSAFNDFHSYRHIFLMCPPLQFKSFSNLEMSHGRNPLLLVNCIVLLLLAHTFEMFVFYSSLSLVSEGASFVIL